jgi:undecaprenyl-diphosphatase
MASNFFEISILSLAQGISEFLPISSAAHLILIEQILKLENQNLIIDISLHLGSLLAIIFYFRKDFFNFKKNINFFSKILIATIPLLPVGYFLTESGLIHELRNIKVIAWTTLIFGFLLYISDKSNVSKKLNNDFHFKNYIWFGLFQVLSLIPGVSRAGITITAGRFLGFNRVDSSKVSFYLSIPALSVVSLFGIINLVEKSLEFNIIAFLSIFLSFIFSLITIKYFLKFIKKFNLNVFVIYRIILSLILFKIIYF